MSFGKDSGPSVWTLSDLAGPTEREPGREVNFCPVLGLPIVDSLRVRTLPGFHVLSLDAGKEAVARGFYMLGGEKIPCQDLEYLHADDQVFLCSEDNKAFLNEMSMRYHKYMGHELLTRKAERKRLRELGGRRGRNRAAAKAAEPVLVDNRTAAAAAAASAGADTSQRKLEDPYSHGAVADPYLQPPAGAAAPAATPPAAAAPVPEKPAKVPKEKKEKKESRKRRAAAAAAVIATPTALATPTPTATPLATPIVGGEDYAQSSPVGPASPTHPDPVPMASPVIPPPTPEDVLGLEETTMTATTTTSTTMAAPAAASYSFDDDDDMYGDLGAPAKKQKTDSSYASAMSSILEGGFDDDDE